MNKAFRNLVIWLCVSLMFNSLVSTQVLAAGLEAEAPAETLQNLPKFALPALGSMAVEVDKSKAQPQSDKDSQQAGVFSTTPKASIAISRPSQPAPAQVLKSGQVLGQETILPNGLKVLIVENHEFPVVSTLVFYRVGSRDEQTGSTGLSHMVEHLMFQEVGPFKAGDIGSMIARVGGQFNGYTSDDFTTFFETLPAGKLEMALKIESERMAHTKFSQSELNQEISNIVKELEGESKDPQALLSKEVRAMMFMQHPYHNPTIGWKTDVEGLTTTHAKEFYEKYFRPNNATLIISGDVNPKQALPLVQKYFAGIVGNGKGPVAHVAVTEPLPRSERRVNTKYDGNKEVMQLAYRVPAMEDADCAAMVVMEKLLNGGLNGKLKGRLIDSKLCSSAQAGYEIKREPGLFTITCQAVPATYNAQARILEAIDSVLSQLRDKAPSDAEARRARNQAEFAYFAECDGPYRAGFHLGYFECLDKWQSNYSWAEKIRAVTAADLNRVARKYFQPETRVVGWISGSSAPKAQPPKPASSPTGIVPQDNKPGTSKKFEHIKLTGYKESDTDVAPGQKSAAKNKEKKSGIPAVIRDIPQALGNAVTGNIPGAVGNVGSAIINLPGAIGDTVTAVGTTATGLGKQILALKPPASLETDSPYISHRVMKNGLNVVVYESHVSPIVQMSGSIQAGEAYSNRNKPGYSQLAASLLSQGSVRRNKAQLMANQDDAGIAAGHMLKYDSNSETIDFSTRCLSRDFSSQLDLLCENLTQPLFDEASLDKAKQEASASIKHNQDFIGRKVNRLLLQGLLDENSPFCPSDPSDRLKTIGSADLTETQKFFSNHIVPGATTLVIAGDVNPEQAFTMVEKSLGKWNGKSSHSQQKAKIRVQRVLRSSLPVKDSKKSNICFGQIIPMTQSHPDFGSLLLADCILVNHPMFSRFEQALSKNPALENAIANGDMTVKLEPLSNLSQWSLSLFLDPSAVQVSVKTIKNELRQIVRVGITPEEFTEAKRYLLGSLPVRTKSTLGSVCSEVLESAEHSDTINGYNAEMDSIKAATIDSVNKMIRTVFRPDQSTIVIAGGAQSIKAARGPLDGSASTGSSEPGAKTQPPSASSSNGAEKKQNTKPDNTKKLNKVKN